MNKLYIFFLFLILSNCSFKPVIKQHGVPFLLKKQENLKVNLSNKNDIIKTLGQPSTKSKFNNDVWIYIERQQTQSKIKNLGRMRILRNDVVVMEIDSYGILKKKKIYNMDDMKKIDVEKETTKSNFEKRSFIYNFMASMRQKMNDPLGTRAEKRKEINQR